MLNKTNITESHTFYDNEVTTTKTQKIPEINSKITGNQTKGQFSDSDVAFPHEDIILKALKIVEENPSIGKLMPDIRTREIKGGDIETTFNHRLQILIPKNIAVAAIADTYKNKYNINIYFINSNITDSLFELAQQLDNGKKIGVIIRLYTHQTPVIISKNNDKLRIVVLDSVVVKPKFSIFIDDAYVKLIQKYGKTKCYLLYAGEKRQQDRYSCMNDAFIVLKDALRKPNLINELFKNSTTVRDDFTTKINFKKFPPFLYKTVQNKKLLDKLPSKKLQTPLKEATDTSVKVIKKTLRTHLDKYSRSITAYKESCIYGGKSIITRSKKDWVVNFYLQIKGYRMLVNAFRTIDDGNGKINQEKAELLMKKYINPKLLIKS